MPILQYNLGGEQPPQGQNNESGRPASSNQAKLESLKNTSDRSQRGFSNIGARSTTKFPNAGVRSTSGFPNTGFISPSESRYYSGHHPNNFQPLGNHHDHDHVVFNRIQPAEAKQQTAAGLQQETNYQLPLYQAQTKNNYHPSLNQPSSAATIHPIGYQKTTPIISFVRPNVLIYTHVVSIPPAPYFPDLQHHRQAQDQEICRTIDSFQTSQGFGSLATQIQDPRDFGILNRYQTTTEAQQGNNFHAQQTTFQVKHIK